LRRMYSFHPFKAISVGTIKFSNTVTNRLSCFSRVNRAEFRVLLKWFFSTKQLF
jgi:hypothetical protein